MKSMTRAFSFPFHVCMHAYVHVGRVPENEYAIQYFQRHCFGSETSVSPSHMQASFFVPLLCILFVCYIGTCFPL
jgi:hypothetical protein